MGPSPRVLRKLVGQYDGIMELVFLGTGGGGSSVFRNSAAVALKLPRENWLFDCGEGTGRQMTKHGDLSTGATKRIFITHLHGDHLFGLPGFLCEISGALSESEEEQHIDVYGPPGVFDAVNTMLMLSNASLNAITVHIHEFIKSSNKKAAVSPYKRLPMHKKIQLHTIEATEHTDGFPIWTPVDNGVYTVTASPVQHTIQTLGYVIEENPIQQNIDSVKCKTLGLLPGPNYKILKSGKSVVSDDGDVIHPHQVLLPKEYKERKVVILGDHCDARNFEVLGKGAAVLVTESTLLSNMQHEKYKRGHFTAQCAGDLARKMQVSNVFLTHFSGRFMPSGE